MKSGPAAEGTGSDDCDVRFRFHGDEIALRRLRIAEMARQGKMGTEIPVGYTPCAMNRRTKLSFGCLWLLCSAASLLISPMLPAWGQAAAPSRAAAMFDSMPRAKRIGEAGLSPDGSLVAYIVSGKITVTPAGGGAPHEIAVQGNLQLRDVAWSAD